MSLTRLPAELRRRAACQHLLGPLHQRRHASVLFALSALSNSRETQHFNKATKLSRVEHSPALKLIQTSEVDPFAPPKPAAREASSIADGSKKEGVVAAEGASSGHTANAVPTSSSGLVPPPTGSGGNGDGKKPPSGAEAAADNEVDVNDKEALKIGRAFLGEHVQEKRRLRQELGEARAEIETLKKAGEETAEKLREREERAKHDALVRRESPRSRFSWVVWLILGISAYLFIQYEVPIEMVNKRIDRLKKELKEAKANTPTVEEILKNKSNATKATQLNTAEKELRELKTQMARDKKHLEEQAKNGVHLLRSEKDKTQAHEAKMADWAKRAEDLKRAVEKKDASTLSKAEQNAYLEALVFLGVKQRPERRWWNGLFWRQE